MRRYSLKEVLTAELSLPPNTGCEGAERPRVYESIASVQSLEKSLTEMRSLSRQTPQNKTMMVQKRLSRGCQLTPNTSLSDCLATRSMHAAADDLSKTAASRLMHWRVANCTDVNHTVVPSVTVTATNGALLGIGRRPSELSTMHCTGPR
jgi:hypothetical protein